MKSKQHWECVCSSVTLLHTNLYLKDETFWRFERHTSKPHLFSLYTEVLLKEHSFFSLYICSKLQHKILKCLEFLPTTVAEFHCKATSCRSYSVSISVSPASPAMNYTYIQVITITLLHILCVLKYLFCYGGF